MKTITHQCDSIFEWQHDEYIYIGDIPYVLKKISRGGMGCVFLLAQDHEKAPPRFSSLGIKIALKVMLPEFCDENAKNLFKNELMVWSGLQHPNIVRLLHIIDGKEDGLIAAMHWHNGSLRDILRCSGSLSIADRAYVMNNILEGIAHANKKDEIIHLDIKPENILFNGPHDFSSFLSRPLSENFSFMISDWGISSFKSHYKKLSKNENFKFYNNFQTLNNVGTTKYMAPERFDVGVSSSIYSDIFSLGMMYFEMLTGEMPFTAQMNIIKSITSGDYLVKALDILKKRNTPKSIREIVMAMISLDKESRPDNFDELNKIITKSSSSLSLFFGKIFNNK